MSTHSGETPNDDDREDFAVLRNCQTGEVIRYATRQEYLRDMYDGAEYDSELEMLHDLCPGMVLEPNDAIERFRSMIQRLRA